MHYTNVCLYTVFILLPFIFAPLSSNNSCKSYWSYLIPYFASDCYHNPDVGNNASEIIMRHIGSFEAHEVQTEDGYILGLHRIPRKNAKGVILLQHCAGCDSRIWVAQNGESVAFLFWRNGYDVWLGNTRGTRVSKKHVTLKPSDPQFWNYSFHELGYYDIKANVDYIRSKTDMAKIIYLGYSMGGTGGIVYAITRPNEAAESIRIMIPMGAGTYFKHLNNPVQYLDSLLSLSMHHSDITGVYTLLGYNSWHLTLIRNFFVYVPFKKLLAYFLASFNGWTPDEFDPKFANLFATQFGSECSLKVWNHYSQLISSRNFQMYDYGKENMKVYDQETPPSYEIADIRVPVFIVYSEDDTISLPSDNELLYSTLPSSSRVYGKLKVDGMNHYDFAFGRHRNQKIYSKILDLLEDI